MTPAEINRAIAESISEHFNCGTVIERDFYNDLNACAEFERALLGGNAKQNIHSTNRYTNELCKLLQCLDTALFQFATATAPQRCEAYLKTIGKWRGQ